MDRSAYPKKVSDLLLQHSFSYDLLFFIALASLQTSSLCHSWELSHVLCLINHYSEWTILYDDKIYIVNSNLSYSN